MAYPEQCGDHPVGYTPPHLWATEPGSVYRREWYEVKPPPSGGGFVPWRSILTVALFLGALVGFAFVAS